MRIAIVVARRAQHQVETAEAMRSGISACGDYAEVMTSDAEFLERDGFDAVCVWGWRRGRVFRQLGRQVLVMERAFVADRFSWVSLGWNGLNGRAAWPDVDDPSRWQLHFSGLMREWRHAGQAKNALLLGQVPSDTACAGVDFVPWLCNVASHLAKMGKRVVFRPHPKSPPFFVPGATRSPDGRSLEEDMEGADFAVTYNSNSGVDAVLAGVPTVSYDPGSMAWPVSAHSVDERLQTPSRAEWAHRMAWRQWLPEEIATGIAWPTVKGALRV